MAANNRQTGSYPETGFEEVGVRPVLRSTGFPPTGLLARNNFRIAREFGCLGDRAEKPV
jgi:hypothetical protein